MSVESLLDSLDYFQSLSVNIMTSVSSNGLVFAMFSLGAVPQNPRVRQVRPVANQNMPWQAPW